MLELQKGMDATVLDLMVKTLEDGADELGQPTMISLTKLMNSKFDACERIQKEGMKAIANAHKLSIWDNGDDAGDSGFGDGGNDGQVQNEWLIDGAFRFVPPDFTMPSCMLEQGIRCWFKGMKLENGVIWPF